MAFFRRWIWIIFTVAFCLLALFGLWAATRFFMGPFPTVEPPTYAELVTIILTAITVGLAILALIVGIMAVWGYVGMKEAAIVAARVIATDATARHLKSDEMRAMLKEVIEAQNLALSATVPIFNDAETYVASVDSDQIAAKYPGDRE